MHFFLLPFHSQPQEKSQHCLPHQGTMGVTVGRFWENERQLLNAKQPSVQTNPWNVMQVKKYKKLKKLFFSRK
jgi:hypothetical protein